MIANIIGNGPSRTHFDLSKLENTYGCNALYRDFSPNTLVAVDIPMQIEIVNSGYYKEHRVAFADWDATPIDMLEQFKMMLTFDTRNNEITTHNLTDASTHFFSQGSSLQGTTEILCFEEPNQITPFTDPLLRDLVCGSTAVGLACLEGATEVNLIGFDSLWSESYDNIYKGTNNYDWEEEDTFRVLTAQKDQLMAIVKHFENVSFNFQKSLTDTHEIEYNILNNQEEWVLGSGYVDRIPMFPDYEVE